MQAHNANPGRVLSFTDHLEELRVRIIICIVWFALCFSACLAFSPQIVSWLISPLTSLEHPPPAGRELVLRLSPDGSLSYAGVMEGEQLSADAPLTTRTLSGVVRDRFRIEMPYGQPAIIAGGRGSFNSLVYLSPLDPIMLLIKGALLACMTFVLPMVVYQFWLFIAPGLMRRERKAVKWILGSSLLLFPAGAFFAWLIAGVALKALISFGDLIPGLMPNITAAKGVGLILGLMLAFGFCFEFPLVLVLLARMGVITSEFLVRRRRIAIVIIAVVAAFVTPTPDPFTMILMLLPLLALYEGSIWAIRVLERAEAADKAVALREKSVDA